ncbi:MAG: hypothetical protein IT377_18785 [Polyangiaceae bacterium]|nr:hypothetical protein [Polyangiaceae bacterium]
MARLVIEPGEDALAKPGHLVPEPGEHHLVSIGHPGERLFRQQLKLLVRGFERRITEVSVSLVGRGAHGKSLRETASLSNRGLDEFLATG